MSVRPISNVSLNNYNNVTFGAKKSRKTANPLNHGNPVSHKLAVPTAALVLATMPQSSSAIPEWENINTIEYSQELEHLDDAATYRLVPEEKQERKVLQKATVLNASPKYGNCLMELVSDDGGKTGNMILTFEENTKFNGYIDGEKGERIKVPMIKTTLHSVEVDTIKTVHNHPNRNNLNYSYPTHYVVGKTTIVNIVRRNDGTNIVERMSSKDYPNEEYELTKEFYNDLKSFLGDLVPYKTEDKY